MSLAQLHALTDLVFAAGGPDANAVKSKIDQVDRAIKKLDPIKVSDAAFNANRLVFQKYDGPQPLAGTDAQVAQLISGIFCFAGINITISDPANSNIIDPSATTQVVTAKDNSAATQLPPGSITEPTVLEFTKVPNSFTTPGAGPLNTRLDQYPGFYLIQAGSASGSGPATPVVVAICPDASVPASIRARLRLGHEKSTGFEIAPPADASFLVCPAPTSVGFFEGLVDKVASKLLPKTLYATIAKQEEFRGGVGGTASEFSPFDPVDPELEFRGGVGGTAGEFKKSPGKDSILSLPLPRRKRGMELPKAVAAPGLSANSVECPVVEAPWSSPLATPCRPGIVITTHLGTVLEDVPVSWNVVLGGGTIASEASGSQDCGVFGASAANTTDANGRAGVCWNMGPTLGLNSVTATPSVGGDAPDGVTFVPTTTTFEATAIKVTPVVAVSCPASVVYNSADQTPCSSTVTDAVHTIDLGAVPVTYGPTSPPRDVGTYTADASYPGAAMYFPAIAPQQSFDITPATPVVSLTCAPSVEYTGADQTPCSAIATGVGSDGTLSPAPTVTYDPSPVNNVGHYAVNAAFAATLNYVAASATPSATKVMGTPTVTISCDPTSVVFNGAVQTPCTAEVKGQGGVHLTFVPVTYGPPSPVNVGTYTANASFAGTDLYHPASAAQQTFSITPATPTVNVLCPVSVPFNGANQTPCSASAMGVGGAPLGAVPVSYSPSPANAVGSYTATGTFTAGGNYIGAIGVGAFDILPPTGFFDGFETVLAWTPSGFWNRNTLTGVTNTLFPNYVNAPPGESPGGKLPSPKTGSFAYWYGQTATGSYIGTQQAGDTPGSGGFSVGANTGSLISPLIAVTTSLATTPTLSFDTWWEIESVDPHAFDIMRISIVDVDAPPPATQLGVLNPTDDPNGSPTTPFTSGGFNAPPVWTHVSIDLSAWRGKRIKVVFNFNTIDGQFNGYRGWVIDNVDVSNANAALRAAGAGTRVINNLNPVPPVIIRPQP